MKFSGSLARLVVGVIVLLSAQAASAAPQVVIAFGDSLSDRKNLLIDSATQTGGALVAPPPTRYLDGRFGNGPIWLELLAGSLGQGSELRASQEIPADLVQSALLSGSVSVSYAYGGSVTGLGTTTTPDGLFQVPGLRQQVAEFAIDLDGARAPAGALYSLWAGSNDYLFALDSGTDPVAFVGQVVFNIGASVNALYELGARKFLLPNLSQIGDVPLVSAFEALQGLPAGSLGTQLNQLTLAHNALLDATVDQLRATLPGIDIVELDVFALSEQAGGLLPLVPGPASGCLFANVGIGDPATCLEFVDPATPAGFFWDELHPSALVHQVLGAAAVQAVPAPAGIWLLVAGTAGLLIRRRRRPYQGIS
ncbi:MAG: SGNH/GDSL hydrolase family protein [Gammaproteobacteria bacterium]|nr:SGNH/GDSL hydrolase family protein [Gammaproteobacteria bacterium]